MLEVEVDGDIEVIVNTNVEVAAGNMNVAIIEDTNDIEVTVNRQEYVITGDEIYIPKRFEDAPTWMQNLINQVVDVSISAQILDMNRISQSLESMIDAMKVAKNTYEMSVVSSNDIDERINTAVTTLNSSMNNADATILEVAQTRVTPEEASAITVDVITAELAKTEAGTLGATVSNLQTAVANEEEARSTSIEILTSSIEGAFDANATAMNYINTYVGLDEVGASTGTGLSGYLESSTGIIGGADSKVVNNVYVDALGNAKSKFEYGSTVSVNGVTSTAGFGLSNSTGTGIGSEFWINAAKFKFTNNNKTGSKAPFTIDASGATPQISFNGIVNFSNITNTTGTGSNLLYNSAPKIGSETKGWYVWTNSGMVVNLSAGFDIWKPTGGASVAANIGGNPSIGSVYDVGQSSRFPVIAGSRYEASAYISAHRSNSYVSLLFYDIAGNYIVEAQGNVINYAGSNALVNWGRSSVFTTAPGNAATALLIIRSVVTSNDPYCFVTNAFAGVAEANQTTPSNWSEGTSAGATYTSELSNDAGYVLPAGVANAINTNTTTINGSKITTGSIAAAQIAANSITAAQIDAYAITGKQITGGTINGTDINGVRITGAIIKASFIDYTSNLALSNWQYFTPSNVPVAYIGNFAHHNEGSLLVDSQGYVRLPAQSGFKTTGTIKTLGGDIAVGGGSTSVPYNATYNEVFNVYPWNDYTINTLNRAIYPEVNTTYLSGEFKIETYCTIRNYSYVQGVDGSHNYYDFYIKFLGDTIQGHSYINTNSSGANSWRAWIVNGVNVGTSYSKTIKGITYTLSSEDYAHVYENPSPGSWDPIYYGYGDKFTMTADFTGNKTITAYNFDDLIQVVRSEGSLYVSPDEPSKAYVCKFEHAVKYPVLNIL